MKDTKAEPADSSVRFDRMEGLLKSYPNISDEDLRELKHWFAKEASSFEIASIASKEAAEEGYKKFRADHVDKFNALEAIIIGVVILGVASLVLFYL